MKRILKQLIRLFPDSYTVISKRHEIGKHTHLDVITDKGILYTAYISNSEAFNEASHTSEFETLKELDKYLTKTLTDYKQIYK